MTQSTRLAELRPGDFSRVIVLGCSGAGKSTLAAALATQLGIPFIATDPVYWRPGWIPAQADELRGWLEAVTAHSRWVLDGNFDAQRDILWNRAELAAWLDLPWTVTVWRVLRRNLCSWLRQTPVCGDLRMTLRHPLSGIRHAAKSHGLKRRVYPSLLREFPTLTVIHVRSAREVRVVRIRG